jgi:hypothetical protein
LAGVYQNEIKNQQNLKGGLESVRGKNFKKFLTRISGT